MAKTTVPDWSGTFWIVDGGSVGVMAVHVNDERDHSVPEGWKLIYDGVDGDELVYLFSISESDARAS